ncbi:MAG: hypothetical protein HS113_09965 [Verrucomicrobiales bacterium]|nr:hypothetical protein [Verrucomicrobiales bacterium]
MKPPLPGPFLFAASLVVSAGLLAVHAAAPAAPQGFIKAKEFLNIGGTVVADLTGNPKFPNSPDVVAYPTLFEWPAGADLNTPPPGDVKDNYGVQILGYFYPPSTGDYIFYLASDDGGNLYLSTDSDPANKKLIAQETGWSGVRSFTAIGGGSTVEAKNSQTFANTQWPTKDTIMGGARITLQANQPYYIEALSKEGGGGDNLAVAVQDPQGTIDATLPIPGNRLSPADLVPAAIILAQPQDAFVYAGALAGFSVGFDIPPPGTLTSIKWTKNGADIPNSNASSITVTTVAADNNAKIQAIVTTSAGVLTSQEATLYVAELRNEFAMGVVKFEAFTDIGGTAIQALLDAAKFQNNQPDDFRLITGIDTPNGYGDNYGARVSGFIVPPESGNYHFFIRSDDASALYLSANETPPDPAWDWPIAQETGCCAAFQEPGAEETTLDPIAMVAGRKYAFIALVKEGGGGDYLQVAARKEGDSTPAASLRPLSGAWIGVNAKPSVGTPEITRQPEGIPQLVAGTRGELSLEARVVPAGFNFPVLVQWRKNGTAIPGATALTYVIPNAAAGDSGTYTALVSAPSGQSVTSAEAVVNVVSDIFPPKIAGAGAVPSETGTTWDVGVSFDEPVTAASAGALANYTLSAGTISSVKFYPGSPGVVLTASGLTAGNSYTVTVRNVADLGGNVMAETAKEFKASRMKWGVVGGKELGLGNGVLTVAENGFDVYSDAIGEWGTYDEATFVYEEVTGDFDKVVQVEYQDASSQWARAGLIVRDVTNFGVDRATQEAGEAGRYQKVHVNPVVTAMGTAGNNAWEGNRRLSTGSATTSAGGGGGPLTYPNTWCRLQRAGDLFTIYRSTDGRTWTQLGTTTFPEPMPARLFVGPEFSPENGNIGEGTGLRGVWLAKFRNYGTYSPFVEPTLSYSNAGGVTVLTYSGVLQSAPAVTGPYTPVAGATSPYTVNKTQPAQFYRAAGQ